MVIQHYKSDTISIIHVQVFMIIVYILFSVLLMIYGINCIKHSLGRWHSCDNDNNLNIGCLIHQFTYRCELNIIMLIRLYGQVICVIRWINYGNPSDIGHPILKDHLAFPVNRCVTINFRNTL